MKNYPNLSITCETAFWVPAWYTVMGWLVFPPNSHFQVLSPFPQIVTLFESCKEGKVVGWLWGEKLEIKRFLESSIDIICNTVFFFLFLFRVAPVAYGSFQARGWIRAAGLHTTAMPDLSRICDLCYSLLQCPSLVSLSEAGDGSFILLDTSQVHNLLSHSGNSHLLFHLLSSFEYLNILVFSVHRMTGMH